MFAAIIAIAVALAGGGTVAASQNDLPGDALYSVKIVSENVRQAFTFSPSAKVEVKASTAAKRARELVELKKRDGAVSAEAVAEATNRYEKLLEEINELSNDLTSEKKMVITPRALELIAASLPELEQLRAALATSTRKDIDTAVRAALATELKLSEEEKDAAKQEPSLIGLKERAENKINEVSKKVLSVKTELALLANLDASTTARIALAETLLADARVKFATGTYADAFILAKEAQKAAIEAKQSLHRAKLDIAERDEDDEDDDKDEKRLKDNATSTIKAERNGRTETDKDDDEDEDEDDEDKEEKDDESEIRNTSRKKDGVLRVTAE